MQEPLSVSIQWKHKVHPSTTLAPTTKPEICSKLGKTISFAYPLGRHSNITLVKEKVQPSFRLLNVWTITTLQEHAPNPHPLPAADDLLENCQSPMASNKVPRLLKTTV